MHTTKGSIESRYWSSSCSVSVCCICQWCCYIVTFWPSEWKVPFSMRKSKNANFVTTNLVPLVCCRPFANKTWKKFCDYVDPNRYKILRENRHVIRKPCVPFGARGICVFIYQTFLSRLHFSGQRGEQTWVGRKATFREDTALQYKFIGLAA